MTIIVTGGAGFIGSNFILGWIKTTDELVVNFDKLTYSGNLKNLVSVSRYENYFFVKGDIADSNLMLQTLFKFRPRTIVNFAAESHVDKSINAPKAFIETNIVGTFQLLETVRIYLESLKKSERSTFRFLHISTDEVYGSLESNEDSSVESSPYKPNNPYSASKASSNMIARAYHRTYGIPTIVLNSTNNYGPRHFPEKLIPLTISNALNLSPLILYGDGQQIRDWIYVEDHCNAIRSILENGRIGEVYNIGGNCEKTNTQIVELVCRTLDHLHPNPHYSYKSQIIYSTDRPGHDRRYSLNTSKIRKELGWQPLETLENGIKKTVRWYLNNRSWIDESMSYT